MKPYILATVTLLLASPAAAQRISAPSPVTAPIFVQAGGSPTFQRARVIDQLLIGPVLPYTTAVKFQVEEDSGVEPYNHTIARIRRIGGNSAGVALGYLADGVEDIGGLVRSTGTQMPLALGYLEPGGIEAPILWMIPGLFPPSTVKVVIPTQGGVGDVPACFAEDGTLHRCGS